MPEGLREGLQRHPFFFRKRYSGKPGPFPLFGGWGHAQLHKIFNKLICSIIQQLKIYLTVSILTRPKLN